MPDQTNPDHYKRLDPEPITVIERWGLGFCEGNAVKYLARAGHKAGQSRDLDLAKARWYIDRAIADRDAADRLDIEAEVDLEADRVLDENEDLRATIAQLQHEVDQWKATARVLSFDDKADRG